MISLSSSPSNALNVRERAFSGASSPSAACSGRSGGASARAGVTAASSDLVVSNVTFEKSFTDDPIIPGGTVGFDDFFGEIESYRNDLTIRVPVESRTADVDIAVRFQGCADLGVCYPPHRQNHLGRIRQKGSPRSPLHYRW